MVRGQPVHSGRSLLDAWIRRDAARAQFLAQMERYPIPVVPGCGPSPRSVMANAVGKFDGKTVNYLDAWSYTEFFKPVRQSRPRWFPWPLVRGVAHRSADRRAAWEEKQCVVRRSRAGETLGAWRIPGEWKASVSGK